MRSYSQRPIGFIMKRASQGWNHDFERFPIARVKAFVYIPEGNVTSSLSTFIIDDPGAYMEIFKEHLFEDIFDEQLYTLTFETE